MDILLIDDHPLFGVGLMHALMQADSGVSVRTALTLADGLTAAARYEPDIVLIDYRLGSSAAESGIAGLFHFGARHPLVARVLISGDEGPDLVARARVTGASGFLGKSLPLPVLLAALRHIADGGTVFDARRLPTAPEPIRPWPAADGIRTNDPTPRQLEVLQLVAKGEPNKRIALELGIAERTVKLHITGLLDSLGARNRTHLLVRARETGLL
ncbi:MAG: response regulator transcription factor [Proteobacteria bacterium]|nr:response regulator transcription factor [Pseudomonadota bacterium]